MEIINTEAIIYILKAIQKDASIFQRSQDSWL